MIGLPRDCSKYKTKLVARNALNPIWEETFELEISLPELALIRFNVIEGASNAVTAQRVVPVNRLRPGRDLCKNYSGNVLFYSNF